MQKKIMLIDGNSIINRAFYGIPLLTNAEGRYTNAVYGFLNILFKLLDEECPEYLAVAFDLAAPTFRHKKYEEYKGKRKGMPNELREQIPLLKEVLSAMKIRQYEMEGYEADDILGTLSKKAEDAGLAPIVISGDRDLLQLASSILKVRIPKSYRGKPVTENYHAQDVEALYGVTPTELIDFKALMGDSSDNIPGVPAIGEKTARKIIQQFHNIETAIENVAVIKPKIASTNLLKYKEQAILCKELVTIIRDMPIELDLEQMDITKPFGAEAYELFKRLEFKSLLERVKPPVSDFLKAEGTNYMKIGREEQWKEWVEKIKPEEVTAYIILEEQNQIKGMAFYNQSLGGFWAESGNGFSEKALVEPARNFFEKEEFQKISHNAKKDMKYLRKHEIKESAVLFDTAIAGYVLNSTRDAYEYNDIAGEFLNQIYPSEEEILGRKKKKKPFSSLPEPQKTNFVVCQADIMFQAYPVMKQKIEENNQHELYYDIELPLMFVLADMEEYGIRIQKEQLMQYQDALEKSLESITHEIFTMSGEEFNINSPRQLGTILFEKLQLPGGKKTKTGGYSTGAEILEKIRMDHPIVEKILLFRQLSKLKSTYADGLLNGMDPQTGKIYSTFHQTITATGRISSAEPNLQNIPIRLELGRELRKVFIPTDENYIFLDADYSQIELRVLAHAAGDETLIEAFCRNQDIHRLTASQVFNIPFDEVTPSQRNNAKAVNFGIVYGIGAFSLSQDLGISRQEAETYINGYFAKYPKIKTYMDETIKKARETEYVSTIFNRRRAMPELSAQNFVQRSFGERVAMNMPIQGSAADIIKIAMVKVSRRLKELHLKSRLILQVHDELLLEAHREELEEVKELLKYEMEHAVKLNVPLKVDVHFGETWFDAK